ncbi:MAG TPA: hypothetical protein VKA46_43205 [Gemmataceae bacterium]|nr:hypothetical protein [Gemmataceae bacterium]
MSERSFARRSAWVLLGLLLTQSLRAADQPRLVTQTGHSLATYAAVFSADGRWV